MRPPSAERATERAPAVRAAATGAVVTLAGTVLSGPVSLALVRLHPQPPWSGPEAFAPIIRSSPFPTSPGSCWWAGRCT